eukprot:scaffold208517_cov31-Tisochrysis_lutea.AAC.4
MWGVVWLGTGLSSVRATSSASYAGATTSTSFNPDVTDVSHSYTCMEIRMLVLWDPCTAQLGQLTSSEAVVRVASSTDSNIIYCTATTKEVQLEVQRTYQYP